MPSVLRLKNPDGTWYEVTALKGDTGITPNLQVGTVTTGNPGTSAEVTITGTPEEPVLNFKIPKGEPGTGGDGSANIDDTTPSSTTTYSSQKIESELTALNDANAALIEVSKTKPNAENTELWIHPNADEVQLPQIDDSLESEQDTWSSKKIAAEVSKKANDADLAAVAKSGSYNDLTNKPTIPTVPSTLPNPNALTFTGAVNETYDGSAARSVAIPTVPTALKNPNKLTFKGAVTAEYDGSATVEVTIPEGGSGGTSGNYMPVNNNYVSDANSVKTTQITKTNNQTANLPSEITREKWGVIQFVAENDSMGNGTQMYWPIDSAYAGRMYIRGHNKDGWTEWKRYATTSEIPTVPTTLPNPNKLIFTGAVTAEYDGSAPVSVEIPSGGGSIYELPIASPTTLGGVMPVAKTDEMTQPVGVDADGKLWGEPGGAEKWGLLFDLTTEEFVTSIQYTPDKEFSHFLIEVLGRMWNSETDGPYDTSSSNGLSNTLEFIVNTRDSGGIHLPQIYFAGGEEAKCATFPAYIFVDKYGDRYWAYATQPNGNGTIAGSAVFNNCKRGELPREVNLLKVYVRNPHLKEVFSVGTQVRIWGR